MNQRLKMLSIVSLFLTVLLLSDTTFACTCGRSLPCEGYWQVEAVFIGTVKEVSRIGLEEDLGGSKSRYQHLVYQFAVNQSFRGVTTPEIGVIMGITSCGYVFEVGQQYLVYAYRHNLKKEMLTTSICTRTRPIRDAAEDLEYIQGLSKSRPGGSIFGEIVNANHTQEGNNRFLPLESVKVTIEGPGKSVTVTSDSEGKFRASSLPEGNYKVRVSPPDGLSARITESEIKVFDRGCARASFLLYVDGRISGRVLDADGKPLPNAYVILFLADKDKRFSGGSDHAQTDDQGRYEIGLIPPGHYKLSVYYDGPRGEPLKSFPPFYYPGVLIADQAGVVVVGESAKVENVDFHMVPPGERTIEGVVKWPDGKAASNVELIAYLHGGRIRVPIKLDEQGRFSFKGYEGIGIQLVAQIEIEKERWMRSEIKIAEKGDFTGLKLILSLMTK